MVAIAPMLYKDLDFDPKTLVPVALIAEFPSVLVIPPSLPVNNLKEFVAYAKANRGKLNFGGSLGTPPQLMGAHFNKVADLGMTYVPYRGGAPSLPDLMAGRLHMQFDALTLLVPVIRDGKLRALAVQGSERWPTLPDVPTLREAGIDEFPGNAWAGLMAPPKTPRSVVDRINAVVNEILRSTEAQDGFAKLNVLLRPGTPEAFAEFSRQQIPIWGEMVRASGATAQ